jgi:hypothetical protein
MAGKIILVAGKPEVFVDGTDLGQWGRAGHPSQAYDMVDTVTFRDGGHRNKQGLETGEFEWTGLFDVSPAASATGAYETVRDLLSTNGAGAGKVVSWYPEGTAPGAPIAAAAQGIGFSTGRAFNMNYAGGPGDVLEISGAIQQAGTVDNLSFIVGTTITANYTSTNVDMGPSSTLGGRFFFHTIANSATGGNTKWTFVVEHASATNAAYVIATGATATFGTGVTTGAVIISSGQLRRFVRITGTRDSTGGAVQFVVGANRV